MANFNPYVGVEFERNLSFSDGRMPEDLTMAESFWQRLKLQNYTEKLKYDVSSGKPTGAVLKNPKEQILVNDTGYFELEYASTVYKNLNNAKKDWSWMKEVILENAEGLDLLGIGVHPFLQANVDTYFKYRTPKGQFYKILCEGSEFAPGREWDHFQYLNATSDQVNIDLPKGKEFEAMSVLNRLSGLLIALSANAPFEDGKVGHSKSMRQYKQNAMLNGCRYSEDLELSAMPKSEPKNYQWYADMMFDYRPLICSGADKTAGLVIPLYDSGRPPTLVEFLKQDSWQAFSVEGEEVTLKPSTEDFMSPLPRISFWNVKPQLNFSRADDISVAEFLQAMESGEVADLFDKKNVIRFAEVRMIDAAQPGQELAMPALIKGLVINYEEAFDFSEQLKYEDWRKISELAGENGMDWSYAGKSAQEYVTDLLKIAQEGLKSVNDGKELALLDPIRENVEANVCPADYLLSAYEKGGFTEVLKLISYNENR